LEQSGVPASRIQLEVTESVFMTNRQLASHTPPAERELEHANEECEHDERDNRDRRNLETEKLEPEHTTSFLNSKLLPVPDYRIGIAQHGLGLVCFVTHETEILRHTSMDT
jgi:hypothetical protein